MSAAVLLLMALPLAIPNGRARQAMLLGAFLGTLVNFGFGYRAGEAGGKLVYEHGAARAYESDRYIPADDEEDSDSH